jgi:hypothetical protein
MSAGFSYGAHQRPLPSVTPRRGFSLDSKRFGCQIRALRRRALLPAAMVSQLHSLSAEILPALVYRCLLARGSA